jgi:hypothetical protein
VPGCLFGSLLFIVVAVTKGAEQGSWRVKKVFKAWREVATLKSLTVTEKRLLREAPRGRTWVDLSPDVTATRNLLSKGVIRSDPSGQSQVGGAIRYSICSWATVRFRTDPSLVDVPED